MLSLLLKQLNLFSIKCMSKIVAKKVVKNITKIVYKSKKMVYYHVCEILNK